jgi:hypothetical protein
MVNSQWSWQLLFEDFSAYGFSSTCDHYDFFDHYDAMITHN